MDAHERTLIDSYNAAVAELKNIPKGDPRHMRAAQRVLYWNKALKRYRRSGSN